MGESRASQRYVIALDTTYSRLEVGYFRVSGKDYDVLGVFKADGYRHVQLGPGMIRTMLKAFEFEPKQLEFVISRGPGLFTSLRVGATIGQAYAWAKRVPLFAVSSLTAMAIARLHELLSTPSSSLPSEGEVIVLSIADARKKLLYLGGLKVKLPQLELTELPQTLIEIPKLREEIKQQLGELAPQGLAIALEPGYLKEKELKEIAEALKGFNISIISSSAEALLRAHLSHLSQPTSPLNLNLLYLRKPELYKGK